MEIKKSLYRSKLNTFQNEWRIKATCWNHNQSWYRTFIFLSSFSTGPYSRYSLSNNIVLCSNRPDQPVNVTENDIERFIACLLYMPIIKLPSTRNYWSSSLAVPQVANLVPVSQFEELKEFLHFSDSTNATTSDRINKIYPVVDKLNERIQLLPIEESLAVDKQIVPFKGWHSMKQYNPKKPRKWAFKVFVLSGVSRCCYKFEIFTGTSDNVCAPDEPDLGAK